VIQWTVSAGRPATGQSGSTVDWTTGPAGPGFQAAESFLVSFTKSSTAGPLLTRSAQGLTIGTTPQTPTAGETAATATTPGQTSTTVTFSKTFTAQTTDTTLRVFPTVVPTTVDGETADSLIETFEEVTRLTTTGATTTLTQDATTTAAGHVGAVLARTIYQAADTEVIWACANSQLGNLPQQAASAIATSFTRLTVEPIEATAAVQVIDSKNPGTTNTFSLSAQTASLQWQTTRTVSIETTQVRQEALPAETESTVSSTIDAVPSETVYTQFASYSQTLSYVQKTLTQWGSVREKTNFVRAGVQFETTYSSYATRTVLAQEQFTTSESESLFIQGTQVSGTFINSTGGTEAFNYYSLDYEENYVELNGKTVLSAPAQFAATTSLSPTPQRSIAGPIGYKDGANSVCNFYGGGISGSTLYCVGNLHPLQSRQIKTLMPSTFEFFTETENADIVGTVSISGLTASATSTFTTQSDGTTVTQEDTFSFVLDPQGAPRTTTVLQDVRLSVRNLGSYETAHQYIQPGIYFDGQNTVSRSRVFEQAVPTDAIKYFEPVTFFTSRGILAPEESIIWTAPRNSVALPPSA